MDDEIRCLRAEARRLAQGKIRSQVRYPRHFAGPRSPWRGCDFDRVGP